MVGFWCCIISCKLRKAVLCDYAFQNMISVLLIAFRVSVSIDDGEISGIRVACQVRSVTGLEICVVECSRRSRQNSHFSHPL